MFAAESLPRWGLLLSRGFLTASLPRLWPLRGTPESFAGTLGGRVFGFRVLLVRAVVTTLTFLAPAWRLCARPTLKGSGWLVDFGQPVVQLPFVRCCWRLGLETDRERCLLIGVDKLLYCISSPII